MITEKIRKIALEKCEDDGLIDLASLIEELEEIFIEQPEGAVWIDSSSSGVIITVKTFLSK